MLWVWEQEEARQLAAQEGVLASVEAGVSDERVAEEQALAERPEWALVAEAEVLVLVGESARPAQEEARDGEPVGA